MRVVEQLKVDKEIQELKKQLFEVTGENLPFNYDCYNGINDYKAHLQQCVKEGKIVVRPQDKIAMYRFNSVFKK